MTKNICVICNKCFISDRSSHQTCSKECWYKLISKGKIGKLNPRFNDGWRQYFRIKEDIKYCEKCKSKNNLDIHHIDGNHKNNSKDNLIKLCRKCHMIEDKRYFTWNRK